MSNLTKDGKTHFADDDTLAYIAELEEAIAKARTELAGLFADPANPTSEEAIEVTNGHQGDAGCILAAYLTLLAKGGQK